MFAAHLNTPTSCAWLGK